MNASLAVLSKLLIVGWASVWVAALPLFHTHLPGAFEKGVGLPHTVFSSDLPGEFSVFSHHRTASDQAELSAPALHSPELGFVASASLDDGKRKPLGQTASLFLPSVSPDRLLAFRRVHAHPVILPEPGWSPDSHGLRAPPAPVSA
jgi:hypothetical protein